MPDPRDTDVAKRDADAAIAYFQRLIDQGMSRREALDLTAAWVMRNVADRDEEPEEWERG